MAATMLDQDDVTILDRHVLYWDIEHNRPIQPNDQVLNPHTGLMEDVGPKGRIIGPPAIDFFVHNIELPPGQGPFRGLRTKLLSTLDEVVAEIGQQIRDGEYSLMNLSASRYSVVLVLMSSREASDLGRVFQEMQQNLARKTVLKSREAAAVQAATSENIS